MRSRNLVVALLLSCSVTYLNAEQSFQDGILRCYVECHAAENLEQNNDYLGALVNFKAAQAYLQAIHKIDLGWEPDLMNRRIEDAQDAIDRLQHLAEKQVSEEAKKIDYQGPPFSAIKEDALRLQKIHDYWGALKQEEKYLTYLQIVSVIDPKWESNLVIQKTKETQSQIDQLIKLMIQEAEANQPKGSLPAQ